MLEDQHLNGWPEYKKVVIQQLEYLLTETKDTRNTINNVDKQVSKMSIIIDEMAKRIEGLNELRKEVVLNRDQFIKKETYDLKTAHYDIWCNDQNKLHQDIFNRITTLSNTMVPRVEQDIKCNMHEKDIRDLREAKASLEGKASQKSVTTALVITILGFITSLLAIAVHFIPHAGP